MGRIAIRVDRLSKQYKIGASRRHDTLRDHVTAGLKRLFRAGGEHSSRQKTIWALQDVSFEVEQGDIVGIMGRNGAGKSTLLKILSRIVEPTSGRAEIYGRVGSLLDVGTGFHPELTGRENIYLNASILGFRRKEIQRRFDEIVAFSEVEKFIETPVKYYSSGMYVRLAFAVAAHLDPEVLIVDEVLAVGDVAFQAKCMGKIEEMANSGRTVLVVSHNMGTIANLCKTGVWLDEGRVIGQGEIEAQVVGYLSTGTSDRASAVDDLTHKQRSGDGRARFTRLEHVASSGTPRSTHACGDDLNLRMQIISQCDISNVELAVTLKTLSGTRIISSWTREVDFPVLLHKGLQTYQCHFRQVNLRPGHSISVALWMECQGVIDYIEDARFVQVTAGTDTRHLSTDHGEGIVVCDYSWACLTSSPADKDDTSKKDDSSISLQSSEQ